MPDKDRSTDLERLLEENQQLRKRLKKARHETKTLKSSRSWRLTAPLRALASGRNRSGVASAERATTLDVPVSSSLAPPESGDTATSSQRSSKPSAAVGSPKSGAAEPQSITAQEPGGSAETAPPTVDPVERAASERLLANRVAFEYLAVGFKIDAETFEDVAKRFGDAAPPPSASRTVQHAEHSVSELKDALVRAVDEDLEKVGRPDVRIGVTGGLDSRLLYGALQEIYGAERITSYTYGYPGQYDYEFMKLYGPQFATNHQMLDTRDIAWSVEREVESVTGALRPLCYSAKKILARMLTEQGVSQYNIHGFFGDSLTGGIRPATSRQGESYEEARAQFLAKNDRFKLQACFPPDAVRDLIPPRPSTVASNFDNYDLLDFGLRQFQRIGQSSRTRDHMIVPYTNDRWANAILSDSDSAERENKYFALIRDGFPHCFPEFQEHAISTRGTQKVFKEKIMRDAIELNRNLKNSDGSAFVPQVTGVTGRPLPGRQFCEYAEYHNNPHFRVFTDELFSGLRERRLFTEHFCDSVWGSFVAGDKTAAEQVRGLLSFEINLRAGVIRID